MTKSLQTFVRRFGAVLMVAGSCAPAMLHAQTPGIKMDKIGIYDLKAIHEIPLEPEVISKTEENGIIYEQVRFSSVDKIRVFAILSYKKGASKLPGMLVVDRFRANPKKVEAQNNYFAISVAAPDGNMDPNKPDSLGGPKYEQPFTIDDQFRDNPHQSYIYQHTVALLRALDYMETRPEVDLSKTVVSGFSWAGLMVATLHGLDDRPNSFVLFHGLGYYADKDGKSGGQPALMSRANYEMYGSPVYSTLGKKPMYMGLSLDDFFTKVDTIMETYNGLKCDKAFVYAPNRTHAYTSRNEFDGQYPWQTHWQMGTPRPSTIADGTVKMDGNKVIYSCTVEERNPLKYAEILVSYGVAGNWMGRTWHNFPLVKKDDHYEAEIPIYDAKTPFYVVGQISSNQGGTVGNGIQYIDPVSLNVSATTASYPHVLFDPSLKSDLYIRTGVTTWSDDSNDGKGSAIIKPNGAESTVFFQNIEPKLWPNAKQLSIWVKGDGKPGPISAYLMYDANYFLDKDVKNYTEFPMTEGPAMWNGWREFKIDLGNAKNLDRVSALIFEPGGHTLQIGTISWK